MSYQLYADGGTLMNFFAKYKRHIPASILFKCKSDLIGQTGVLSDR